MRLGAVPPDETMPLAAVPAASPPALDGPPRATAPPQTERPRRRRRGLLLPAAGAVVTVVAAAGFASGLFSYNPPERDGALPEDIRASVPEESSPTGTPAPASTASTASPSPAVKPSPSRSPSPSPSASSASPTPSPSATPTATPTTLPATASASPTAPNDGTRRRADVLHPGDKGPEVTELQLRLSQLNLYWGPANGTYDTQVENAVQNYQLTRGVTEDEPGVYGTATRAKLESETRKP
jgi:cytoskeletal protein RodZ